MKYVRTGLLVLFAVGMSAWSQCPCLQVLLQDPSSSESGLHGAVKAVKRLEFDWDAANKRKVLQRIIERQFNARGQFESERWIGKDGKTLLQCRSNDYDANGRLVSSTFIDLEGRPQATAYTRYAYETGGVEVHTREAKGGASLVICASYCCGPGNRISAFTSSSWGATTAEVTLMMDHDCHIVRQEPHGSRLQGGSRLVISEYDEEGHLACVKQFVEGRNRPTDVARYVRDTAGRVLEFSHYNYSGVVDNSVYYYYDSNGLLMKEVVVDSSEGNPSRFEKEYHHDGHGNWIEIRSYLCGRNTEGCPKKSLLAVTRRKIEYW